ncbi:hypothetical protein [Rhizobium sp. 1399]|jgi:hypothetical protein|uniref:hypothetical protein n=1 Tax=Rhizobium sp. 1399 TaxID=2817758 RepID=UPI002862F3EF|nr:hypothetical protein [Rhizobium sp. 1399]MDR6670097.1 hypothetical protein [Rhizobium sp. 1399]
MKWAIALLLALLPATAWACQGLITYDLANPGADPRALRGEYWYFIGRIVAVEEMAGADTDAGVGATVTFEILTDYRLQNKATAITAYVLRSSCFGLPKTGTVGKFGIDDRSGKPVLVQTRFSF